MTTTELAPIRRDERSLAPDLARGLLLLGIALANVWGYLYARPTDAGHRPVGGSDADTVVDVLTTLLIDDRSRPLFAMLYGYGIATMAARMAVRHASPERIRGVLARRSIALVVLGGLHAALLFSGDILAPYGAVGLVALGLVHRRRAVLVRWFVGSAFGWLVFTVLLALAVESSPMEGWDAADPSYLGAVPDRVLTGVGLTVLSTLTLILLPTVLVGFWLQRSGVLDRPWEHRALLRRGVAVAVVADVVGGLPYAAVVGGLLAPPAPVEVALGVLHDASGMVMAFGYVCLIALAAARLHERRDARRSPAVRAVTAVGERSLTCYLLQSVLFAPLLAAWGLGWGETLGTAGAAGLAVGVWLATVAAAVVMDRLGRRGPFEVLLRRISYGSRAVTPLAGGGGPNPGAPVAPVPVARAPRVGGPTAPVPTPPR